MTIALGDHSPAENTAPVTIKGVCLDMERRVLLCRNHRSEWELPGGRPQIGESFAACLVREIAEETGLTATVHALICAYPYEALASRWVNVIVYGDGAGGLVIGLVEAEAASPATRDLQALRHS